MMSFIITINDYNNNKVISKNKKLKNMINIL